MNRVVITGMGAICGLGHSLDEVWGNIVEGKPGISKIENTNIEKLAVQIGGEVKNFAIAEDVLEAKEAPRFDKFIHFALHSGFEAWKDAGLVDHSYDPGRIGTILGVGMGGFPEIESSYETFLAKGPRRISPFFIPAIIPNMASGLMSIKLNLQGVNYTIASACASAAHAISASAFEIMSGRQDVMVTGGAESVLSNLPMGGFISMKALSKSVDEPEKASRPFDKDRNGFVIGEGAGVLILENYDKAKARGARIYAEVVGHGTSSDAHHITAPHPEGDGAYRCMKMCIESAGITPDKVGYVNAHGTSTPLGDLGETKAIKKTFGNHANEMFVSSTKSMTGHLLGAAGGIESIFCAMALYKGVLPPTINLDNQDPECDLDYVANTAKEFQAEYVLNNSFGFGGTNSSLLLKRYTE
ncbi:beta-ketoacyl-[acyl-carrier-protein] synthase II [Halobacteriovorax marinus]|uniref:3-oxoacyl-[acyl-carrier-protein] synthase 2 n=1 Tax=Halobacteriovorax marinus TaxID=97084 RepID=A0A1Y5F9X7_9BACT|nr:beta-ketoacyl-[acyl-carrier-protein] synthase II [Halobacteriovorax marinus]